MAAYIQSFREYYAFSWLIWCSMYVLGYVAQGFEWIARMTLKQTGLDLLSLCPSFPSTLWVPVLSSRLPSQSPGRRRRRRADVRLDGGYTGNLTKEPRTWRTRNSISNPVCLCINMITHSHKSKYCCFSHLSWFLQNSLLSLRVS